ncbi:terpene synthase family protein [Nocardia brasiliensis]|uniref:terpene synthase family protein n=1 Tax=Nocardia brasiliensis TaxID=37326 RepID=UPI0024546D61|nr:hypothetical protein [Nocardia brasiliensis]
MAIGLSTDSLFDIPPIWCPIAPAIHPGHADVEKRMLAWVDEFGLCTDDFQRERVVAARAAELMARMAPRGVDERMLTGANWLIWGFAFDDFYCDPGLGERHTKLEKFVPVAARCLRYFEAPHSWRATDPYMAALGDIAADLRQWAGNTQFRRFADSHYLWFFQVIWEIMNRERQVVATLDDYIVMRLQTVGTIPTMLLTEIVNGIEVAPEEVDQPLTRALTELTIVITACDNDLMSYTQETRGGRSDHNILTVLTNHNELSLQDAAVQVVAMRDRCMALFFQLAERAGKRASTDLNLYLEQLAHTIRGNHDWGFGAPRYTGRPGVEIDHRYSDRSSDTSRDPLPIATIAWWWEL